MDAEKKLLEINEYYHDELDKAMGIMHQLQELEMKYNILLPDYVMSDVNDFLNSFKFKYHDR